MSFGDKTLLRAQCRALREAMTAEMVASASERICERLAEWPTFQKAQTVMAYLAFGNEVSLLPLIRQSRDKRWIIPRTVAKPEPHLILHRYDPVRLVQHRFGMLEPDASLPEIEPGALDLVLVPGLAFDRQGYRLGFGGGFYDRFLPHVTAIKVGIVSTALVVEHVPEDHLDQRVDYLASESGLSATTDH
jgi:5-formyltetrahydrofolate cyclo-ligase